MIGLVRKSAQENQSCVHLSWHGRGYYDYRSLLDLFVHLSRADMHLLLDFSQCAVELSSVDAHRLAGRLADTRLFLGKKIAITLKNSQLDRERPESFFELCSNNRGLNVKLFDSAEKGRTWIVNSLVEPT